MQYQCSAALGKIASLLFSYALQNRLTARLCHCKYTYEDLDFIHGLDKDILPAIAVVHVEASCAQNGLHAVAKTLQVIEGVHSIIVVVL